MKDTFSGFYSYSDEELKQVWNSNDVLFVFDTNVLLNLYSYTESTRNDFFKILDKLSDRIWIPYHVGLEYQLRRLGVISNEKSTAKNIQDKLDKIKSIFHKDFSELKLEQKSPNLSKKTKTLEDKITKLLDSYQKEVASFDEKQPCVRNTDNIRKKIDSLFKNKIGEKPKEQKLLDDLFKEGKERFSNKVPPGYMDEKEKKEKPSYGFDNLTYIPMYGDLILWKQTIEKSKETDINSIIFITDDTKEDWIYSISSNGKKDIGVRAELRQEIQKEANINIFEIYNSSKFMKLGKENLSLIDITDESIKEAKENTEIKRRNELAHSIHGTLFLNEKQHLFTNKLFKSLFIKVAETQQKMEVQEHMLSTKLSREERELVLENLFNLRINLEELNLRIEYEKQKLEKSDFIQGQGQQ